MDHYQSGTSNTTKNHHNSSASFKNLSVSQSHKVLPSLKETYNTRYSNKYQMQQAQSPVIKKINSLAHSFSRELMDFNQDNVALDKTLIKAKQEKNQSYKEVYAMQSRIKKLQIEEESYMRKIENERKKAEELMNIRRSYDEKMQKLREASFDRDQKIGEIYYMNQAKKNQNKQFINEKISQIAQSKKEIHDQIRNMRKQLEQEKVQFKEGIQNQKLLNAELIKQEQKLKKEKLNEIKQLKDKYVKYSYIKRVNEEKARKMQNERQIQSMAQIENDLQERVKKNKELYIYVKPITEKSPKSNLDILNPETTL